MKVTKWSTFSGEFNVSEQHAEQTSVEPGSIVAGPAAPDSSDTPGEAVVASTQEPMPEPAEIVSPKLVPEQGGSEETPRMDLSKADPHTADADKVEGPKVDGAKPDVAGTDAPRAPGRILVMSNERPWVDDDLGPAAKSEPNSTMFGKRRLAALAAVVALAVLAGALGGAMATVSFGHTGGDDAASIANTANVANQALEASIARLDADIQSLKTGAEHASKLGMAQFNKTSERLDKVEKAQAEPAAKLAKLSEAVEKLRVAPPAPAAAATATAAAAKETTGSISPPASASAAPKVEVARLPTVEGWSLRDVANGGALIEGRQGMFEVYAGDPVPGLGRIDAIRRQDGHWVVVTSKGLIVSR
jgi:hypothetical protein